MKHEVLAPTPIAATSVRIKLLGVPQLVIGSDAVSLPRRQMRALLYRLAVSLQPVAREHLCFLLWPDTPEPTARRYLTVLLNLLRQALPKPDMLLAQQDAVLLDPTATIVDTVEFAHGIAEASAQRAITHLQDAVTLYDGPFLHGFTLPASPEFDAWADQERQHWERRYLDALAVLADDYAAHGFYPAAIEAAQRILSVDELAEDVHRRLIELYAVSGDRSAALRQFERCCVVLERELGVSPLPETRAVYEAVRDGRVAAQKPSDSLQPRSERTPINSTLAPKTRLLKLPALLAPLLGRNEELTYASALLIDPTVRLLTLCGPGGSGKTRLAQHIAWNVADVFPDGALFVPLAALRDPTLVLTAIASLCELKQTSISALTDFFGTKHMLLVLDNCEHLLDAGPDIARLLQAAPNLHVLATSRAALNLQGEHTLFVPPLALPDLAHLPPLATLAENPSVALLLARTQEVNEHFHLTHDNAADLAAICVRLDGLPLAIELAAARLKLLPPRDLLRRLDHRLAVLNSGPRDLPNRQQTLRATIEWSYRLLDTSEQLWFERCSVFVGGWTLAATEGLHERLGLLGQERTEPLDALAALVDKSLVQVSTAENGETRFDMLESIREYATERLYERGALDVVMQAHANYFLDFVEEARPHFHSPHIAEWSGRLAVVHANVQVALLYFLDRKANIHQSLQLGTGMYYFWHLRGNYGEGLQWLERVLARSVDSVNPLRASVLSQAGSLATALGQIDQATAFFEECLAFCATVEAPNQHASALNGLGIILNRAGDPRGLVLLEEAVVRTYQQGNPAQICAALRAFANALVTHSDQIERGIAVYEEALQIARQHNLVRNIGMIVAGLGEALMFANQYERALPLLHEGLAIQQQLNNKPMMAWTFPFLGTLHYLRDEWRDAQQYFARTLAIVADIRTLNSLPDTLEGMAGIAAARREPVQAARLLGAAEAFRITLKLEKPPSASQFYDRISTTTRTQLTEVEFHEAYEAGRALSFDQAIAEANAVCDR